MIKFGKGQSVRRTEDPRLLMGRGEYTDDISLPGEAHAAFLRSPHAHARITAIDTAAAAAIPGVLGIFTGQDTKTDGLGTISCMIGIKDKDGNEMSHHQLPLLVDDRVCFVGDNVAMVVAEDAVTARDALEALVVEYDPLPVAAAPLDAIRDDAPQIYDGAPGNRAFYWQTGDDEAVEKAFAKAAHVTELDLVNNRIVSAAVECRAVIGSYDRETGRYTLYAPCQGGHLIRRQLSENTLKVPLEDIRVIVPDVGGGFGTKIFHYPEEALTLWASKKLGRPVRWTGDRGESFLCDTHGRDQTTRAALALDADGRFLALRFHSYAGMGAYLHAFAPYVVAVNYGTMSAGAYATPAIHAVIEGIYCNTVPNDAYRGAGRPEAAYLIERLVDTAARDMGLSPPEMRRRNFIKPDQMPFTTATGHTYDTGDYDKNMTDALLAADWDGFEGRRKAATERGRIRGIGLATYIEVCPGGGEEEATYRFNGDGTVSLYVGTQSNGQGHATAYAQVASQSLGIPFEKIVVVDGDTDLIPFGGGTGGSRSITSGGAAIEAVSAKLIDKGRQTAARLLQSKADEIEYTGGHFSVSGTDRGIGLFELAQAAGEDETLLPDREEEADVGGGLDTRDRFLRDKSTFPNGCHICEVEIDPATGQVTIVNYVVVDDFGNLINPLLVTGQVHGGIAQGLGQALLEKVEYDRHTGQMLNASFMDYCLPRAEHVHPIDLSFNELACTTNPLGVKGAGEAGTTGSCPAIINAIVDALAPFGVRTIDMPATPEKIWRTLQSANNGD